MDLVGKPLNPNKRLKEEFVSNLTGSSMLEIAALSLIVPALVALRQWISFGSANGHFYSRETMAKKYDSVNSRHKGLGSYVLVLALDFFIVILPLLFLFTVLAEWVYHCAIFLMFLMFVCIVAKRFKSSSKEEPHNLSSLKTSILSYRVSVMVTTCLCILAVDFKIFPRRYAKVETYGTGLMDLGVGSFVVANSLVSRQARNAMATKWKAVLQSIGPLVFLGFVRLISTAGVNYQVHVGEYGVHWNFFFTLAAVSILTSIINIHPKYCGMFGLLILVGYQTCLKYGLSDYLVSKERALDIISQNKEGFFSIFGYWGMYLIGVYLGYTIFFANELSSKAKSVQSARIRVWILCALFWFLTIILDSHVERVSRRMCNLAYITFVLAQNFQVLSVIMLSDFISGQKPLVLEEAFNHNLLGSFLLANVLTGIVNLSLDTLSTSSLVAFGILFGYASILSAAVGFAWFYNIRVKFW